MTLAALTRKPLAWAIGIALLAFAAWWLLGSLLDGKNAATIAKIEAGRADAAAASGHDAAETVATTAANAGDSDDLTRRNHDAITKASGAAAPLDPAVAAAGRDGLCGRRAYSCTPDCVQRAVAAGVARAGAGCPPAPR